MNNFRIVPLSKSYARHLRKTHRDEFGYEVIELVATGLGPCRVSLKLFEVGVDKRLLFTHSPFGIGNAFNQPGPVFINAADVEEYADVYHFPPEIKADKKNFPLTLIGYDDQQIIVFSKLVGDRDVDEMITEIFNQNLNIAYLHARNAQACCFICKIERM